MFLCHDQSLAANKFVEVWIFSYDGQCGDLV